MNVRKNAIKKISVESVKPEPLQLELFRMVSDEKYTNAFSFYESIPRFVVARGHAKFIKWNLDGTAAPLRRHFSYKGADCELILAPAYIKQKDGSLKAQFPGVREEIIEFVLLKLATRDSFLNENEKDADKRTSFTLKTTLYQIRKELEHIETTRGKSRTYSYQQIRDSLFVLAKTNMEISRGNGQDIITCSPLSDF